MKTESPIKTHEASNLNSTVDASSQPRLRVVIIEDNPEDRDFIRRMLLQDNFRKYTVAEANNAVSGIAMCASQSQPPDCVILDLYLPDVSGLEVLKLLRKSSGEIPFPVLVLTGVEGNTDEGRAALALGAQDYLSKTWIKTESLNRSIANAIERFQLTRRLKESEERLRYTLAGARAGSWDWQIATGQIIWSPENYELYGINAVSGGLGHKEWMQAIHADDRERIETSIQTAFETGQADWRNEFRIFHPQLGIRWLLGQGKIEYTGDGAALRMGGINLDITESKRTEVALKDADRRKDEFLATLAHELRNPLAAISNAVQILAQCGPTNIATAGVAREMIIRQVRHMVRLIDDLLDVSRITLGRIELRKEIVALATILKQVLEMSQHDAVSKGHSIVLSLPTDVVKLNADPTRLTQIFMNLLNNSFKYTQKSGQINISAAIIGDTVAVKVADNGMGITPVDLPTIFEIFSQVDTSANRSQGGLGIGLSLVRGLVELHGGRVEARSDGLGRGSEFTVTLPLVSSNAGLEGSNDTPSTNSSAKIVRRILIVDDNADSAESLGMLLQLDGHEVEIAHDGLEGIDMAERYRPHIVLLDIGMPKLDGYETCKHIRRQHWGKSIFIIAQTGWGAEKDRKRTKDAGFDFHFVKPIDSAILIEMLDGLQNVETSKG